MKHLLLSLAVAGVLGLAGIGMEAVAAPQFNNDMPGMAMSGSQNYGKIPKKARKFVDKHFKGFSVVKCENYFSTGKYEVYEVELSDGTDIDFDGKGNVLEIEAGDNSYLATTIVKDLLHRKAYFLLDRRGVIGKVESIELRNNKAVEVVVRNPDPYTFIFHY